MKTSTATPLASRKGLCRTGSKYSNRRTTRRFVRSIQGVRVSSPKRSAGKRTPPRKVGPTVAPKRLKLACEGTILRNPKIHIKYQSGFTSGVPGPGGPNAVNGCGGSTAERRKSAEQQQQELARQQRLIGPE